MSSSDEVFSGDENLGNTTYVKKGKSKTSDSNPSETGKKNSNNTKHPPYLEMLTKAVMKLGGRNGVSRAKICEFIKETYEIEEISNVHILKAIKTSLEKNFIENTTGNGANGSFKITQTYKDVLKKEEADKAKKEKEKLKKENKKENKKDEDMKVSKKTTTESKDDMALLKKKKEKKPPMPPAKGKENKAQTSSKTTQKVLKEKIKTLKKANSTGDMKRKIKNALPDVDGTTDEKKVKPAAPKRTKAK